MAKSTTKKAPPAPKPGKAVATTGGKQLKTADVDVSLLLQQDSGKGVSTAAEDNIIPLIYILQAQSPQAMKQKSECIKPGLGKNATAVAGNIWPRGTKTLIDGEETGMPFIPVAFKKWWVEWRPDRGGFAGRHPYDAADENKGRPEGATWVEDPKNPGMGKWELPSGNVVVETREHAGLGLIDGNWSGCVISMSGSNHTASRAWMGLLKNRKIPKLENGKIVGYTDKRAPSFAYAYCLKTIAKSNDKGDWYGWQAEQGIEDDEVAFVPLLDGGVELYKMARQLNADFESGAKVADAPIEPDDVTGTVAGDEGDDI